MVCPPMRALFLVTEVFSSGGGPVRGAACAAGSAPTFPRPRPCACKDDAATANASAAATIGWFLILPPCMGTLTRWSRVFQYGHAGRHPCSRPESAGEGVPAQGGWTQVCCRSGIPGWPRPLRQQIFHSDKL